MRTDQPALKELLKMNRVIGVITGTNSRYQEKVWGELLEENGCPC